jgi:hypothetical protein
MKKDFTGATATKTGIKTKDVKYSSVGVYLGFVWDPGWAINEGKEEQWITCMWNKSGKCTNRPEFDL